MLTMLVSVDHEKEASTVSDARTAILCHLKEVFPVHVIRAMCDVTVETWF